jgi:hypothetical protein
MADLSGHEMDLLEYVASKEFIANAKDFREQVANRSSYPTLEEADIALGLPIGLMRTAIKVFMAAAEGKAVVLGMSLDERSHN